MNLTGALPTRAAPSAWRWPLRTDTGAHPVVGELRLDFEVLRLPADEGLSMVVDHAEPDSPEADALGLLELGGGQP